MNDVYDSADKSRRAVVYGTDVTCLKRRRRPGYSSPYPVARLEYESESLAHQAAKAWAYHARML